MPLHSPLHYSLDDHGTISVPQTQTRIIRHRFPTPVLGRSGSIPVPKRPLGPPPGINPKLSSFPFSHVNSHSTYPTPYFSPTQSTKHKAYPTNTPREDLPGPTACWASWLQVPSAHVPASDGLTPRPAVL